MSKKQYGTYVVMPVNHGTPQKKKLKMIKTAVTDLLDKISKAAAKTDLDLTTITLIVNEGVIPETDDPSWYADEDINYVPGGSVWAITVGMKVSEREE